MALWSKKNEIIIYAISNYMITFSITALLSTTRGAVMGYFYYF